MLQVFTIILYQNVFQNPEIFGTQVSLSPEQSTLNTAQLLKTVRFPTELCEKDCVTMYLKCSVHFCRHHIYRVSRQNPTKFV
jgi:hypothetical protein